MPYYSIKTAGSEWIVETLDEAKAFPEGPSLLDQHGYIIEHGGEKATGWRAMGHVSDGTPDIILFEFRDGQLMDQMPKSTFFPPEEVRQAAKKERWERFNFSVRFWAVFVATILLTGVCNAVESCVPGMPRSLGGC